METHTRSWSPRRRSSGFITAPPRDSLKRSFGANTITCSTQTEVVSFEEGVVRVHLRRWLEDEDAWTLARYICSPLMQREVSELYRNLQISQINSVNLIPQPDQVLRCGFPFRGPTTLQGVFLRLPGPIPEAPPRWLVLRIERCSARFPFDRVIVDRDNSRARGANVEDEDLIPAWTEAANL